MTKHYHQSVLQRVHVDNRDQSSHRIQRFLEVHFEGHQAFSSQMQLMHSLLRQSNFAVPGDKMDNLRDSYSVKAVHSLEFVNSAKVTAMQALREILCGLSRGGGMKQVSLLMAEFKKNEVMYVFEGLSGSLD